MFLLIVVILVVVGAIGLLLGWFDGDEEESRNDAALADLEANQHKIEEENLMSVASENVTAPTIEELQDLHEIVEPIKKPVGRPCKSQTTH